MIRTTRLFALMTAVLLAASLSLASTAGADRRAHSASSKAYTVKVTVKKGKNLVLLILGRSGSLLASAPIKSDSQATTLKTKSVSTLAGATLQLVNGSKTAGKGSYFGPVLVGWKGSKLAKASGVYTKLKASSSRSLSLGTITVVKVTKKQGYAAVARASKLADSRAAAQALAVKGKPVGVGNYGKITMAKSSSASAQTAQDPPTGPPSGGDQPTGPPTGPPSGGDQPTGGSGATGETLLGGDADKDGLPNAFDVNDDGDSKTDSADSVTPAPKVTGDESGSCATVAFRIFTNFKATQAGFAGTINAYGTGPFEATKDSSIPKAITDTMSMVFSPISSVCDSAVTKTELKGVGVSYAPSDFVELSAACNTGDYQWTIGNGKMCGSQALTSGHAFTGADLPTGQDTFVMRVTTADGKSYEFTSSPGFVFVTHPMVVRYIAGTVAGTINYAASTPGPDGARVNSPSISLAQADTLELELFRPQRLAIDGETGSFYDLGGFKYTPDLPNGAGKCDKLTATDTAMAVDTPSNMATKPTITLSWAIGSCFNIPPRNAAWLPGEMQGGIDIQVEPSGPGGNSAQKLFINAN